MDNSNKTSFVKQGAILAVAGLISRFLGFIYRPLLLGMIGEVGSGYYGQAYTVYFFFLIISSAGLPVAISKMVSERMEKKQYKAAHQVFKVSLRVAAVTGLLSAIILWLGSDFISGLIRSPGLYLSLVALAPTVFIVAIMSVFRGYFQGFNNTVPTAISQLVEQLINVIATLYLAYAFMQSASVSQPNDKFIYGSAGGTAGTGVGAVAGLIIIFGIYLLARPRIFKKISKDKTKLSSISNREIAETLIKISIPIILGTAIFSISNFIDTAMVNTRLQFNGNFTELEATALYGRLSTKFVAITTLPVSISTSLAIAAIPAISASNAVKNYKEVNHKINAALRISMLLSIPAAVGIGVLAGPILSLIFGSYPEGKELLQVGFISIIFLSLAQILTGMLQGIDKLRIPVIGAAIGCLVKIPINYFLVANKNININGAVISTIACYLVASAINWYYLFKYTKVKPDIVSIFAKPLLASAGMALAVYVSYNSFYYIIASNLLSTMMAVLVGVVSYFVIMVLINGLEREDIERFPFGKRISEIIFSIG